MLSNMSKKHFKGHFYTAYTFYDMLDWLGALTIFISYSVKKVKYQVTACPNMVKIPDRAFENLIF